MKKVWILTREINEYNQDGQYFEAVFKEIPDIETLAKYFTSDGYANFPNVMEGIAFLEHLRKGGGRRGTEHQWFNLKEVDVL